MCRTSSVADASLLPASRAATISLPRASLMSFISLSMSACFSACSARSCSTSALEAFQS